MALSSWCIAGSRRIRHLCSGRWSSGCFGFTWGLVEFRKMLWRLPPIHFGREDGVERTLLRVACQSETFLASPWQGDASIRFLWHIGCQSEIDEPVSLASRPVDRGSCRRKCFSTSLYPVKGSFGRMGSGCRFSPAANTPLALALPPFPASRYAELVSGGHLPTISGAHISAPAGPCILRQQNMERQVGRQG